MRVKLTRDQIIRSLEDENKGGRTVMDMTLGELFDIDSESAEVIQNEFEMSIDDHIQIIITDWTICAYSDYNEQVELFAEEYSSFDTETLYNYMEVI